MGERVCVKVRERRVKMTCHLRVVADQSYPSVDLDGSRLLLRWAECVEMERGEDSFDEDSGREEGSGYVDEGERRGNVCVGCEMPF